MNWRGRIVSTLRLGEWRSVLGMASVIVVLHLLGWGVLAGIVAPHRLRRPAIDRAGIERLLGPAARHNRDRAGRLRSLPLSHWHRQPVDLDRPRQGRSSAASGSVQRYGPGRPVGEAGLFSRILAGATRAVRKPWQMYLVGCAFGLGFDTRPRSACSCWPAARLLSACRGTP